MRRSISRSKAKPLGLSLARTRRGGAFSPLSLSPALWLSDTGSNPAQWDDLSGNGRHATQATGINQPAIVTDALNGRQVRRFDGVNDGMFANGAAPVFAGEDSPIAIFAVAKTNTNTGFGMIIAGGNADASVFNLFRLGSSFRYAKRDLLGENVGIESTQINTDWNIHTVVADFENASLWTNGGIEVDNENVNIETLSAIDRVGIGIRSDATNTLDGDIAEILVMPRAVTTAERQQVERYLSNKYAITLA